MQNKKKNLNARNGAALVKICWEVKKKKEKKCEKENERRTSI